MDSLKDVAVGATVALLLLDRVFTFLRPIMGKPTNGSAGGQVKEWWQMEIRNIIREELKNWRPDAD